MEVDKVPSEPEIEDFELDDVNQHPCMQIILKVIDSLSEKFSQDWDQSTTDATMPGWMQKLYDSYTSVDGSELNFSAKIFILKLMVNRPHIFQPYANQWFSLLTDYILLKDTGGKGFHYFIRDICTILINFSDSINLKKSETQKRCNDVLNCLIKFAADKRKLIFTHNINIIGRLMEKWSQCKIELNETMIGKMLSMKDGEIPSPDLWRMAGIQVIALACKVGVQSNLLTHLIKQLEHRKRSIIFSAAEVIGVLLANQPELLEECSQKIQQIFSGEARQDIFVSIVHKISKYQGLFSVEKAILQKLLTYLKPFSANFRACILQSLK